LMGKSRGLDCGKARKVKGGWVLAVIRTKKGGEGPKGEMETTVTKGGRKGKGYCVQRKNPKRCSRREKSMKKRSEEMSILATTSTIQQKGGVRPGDLFSFRLINKPCSGEPPGRQNAKGKK